MRALCRSGRIHRTTRGEKDRSRGVARAIRLPQAALLRDRFAHRVRATATTSRDADAARNQLAFTGIFAARRGRPSPYS
jgi:hypothetical protein